MKNKLVVLLVLATVFSTSLIGCATKEKMNEALVANQTESIEADDSANSSNQNAEAVTEVSNDLELQAEKEGVSAKELETTLDGLAQLGADKYGITKEEYIAQIEASGETVLSEWQLVSENMGMSISQIYKYEKTRSDSLTEEQIETLVNMNDALKMAEVELENMPEIETTPEMGTTDVENMLGIHSNEGGEVRKVSMSDVELRKALTLDTYKVLQDYTDEYSINYEYVTDASYDDITKHYISLIENTKEYLKLEPVEGMGVMLQGTVNEMLVYISVDKSDEGMLRISTYLDLTSK